LNLLLDSHAFLWFVANDPKLSIAAKAAIEAPTNRKWVSVASLWEITIKVSIGKLSLADPVAPFLVRELASNKFSTLDINIDHLAALSNLPFHHRDPFDRIIVSQAIADSISIVSTDVALDAYGVRRIW
jgi:PIN domain nuclease of toxin-antitoxin system